MTLPDARGVYVVAPTPFHPDGRIDDASIDRMTDFFHGAGVTGMTVLGQLGEAPKLEHAESVGVVKRVLARAKVPVVVGVSAPGFAPMRALTRDVAHDLFDAHLPLVRYEQQPGPGLAVRKYVMMRRGIIASDTLRKPGAALSAAARAEVDYLLTRLARKDPRAKV